MRLGGIILAAVVLLGACTSDPVPHEPDPAPTTTSASPARAVPTMPAQASEDSPEGAAAFVKHYVDVFNYAAATGDIDELSRLSSPDCKGCQKYIALYRDTYAAGGYFKGGDWNLSELIVEASASETYITTDVTTSATEYKSHEGKVAKTGPAVTDEITFALVGSGKQRTVSQLALGGAR